LGRPEDFEDFINSVHEPHWELVKKYDIIDFELGVKITGAGFQCIKEKNTVTTRLDQLFLG
jgi:seryl-tRNA synthetase